MKNITKAAGKPCASTAQASCVVPVVESCKFCHLFSQRYGGGSFSVMSGNLVQQRLKRHLAAPHKSETFSLNCQLFVSCVTKGLLRIQLV